MLLIMINALANHASGAAKFAPIPTTVQYAQEVFICMMGGAI
jgi:hypothetical protein